MSKRKLTPEQVLDQFSQGFDCSQVVLSQAAGRAGISGETALKAAAAFGGGMWRGDTCGCVAGALMAIGLRYGTAVPGDSAQKNAMLEKKAEFERRFAQANGSCICREILGHDLSVPEEMSIIQEKNLLATVCPQVVCQAVEILEELL